MHAINPYENGSGKFETDARRQKLISITPARDCTKNGGWILTRADPFLVYVSRVPRVNTEMLVSLLMAPRDFFLAEGWQLTGLFVTLEKSEIDQGLFVWTIMNESRNVEGKFQTLISKYGILSLSWKYVITLSSSESLVEAPDFFCDCGHLN